MCSKFREEVSRDEKIKKLILRNKKIKTKNKTKQNKATKTANIMIYIPHLYYNNSLYLR